MTEKSSFGAIVDERTRVVILGSLPGEVSLQRREYYANPTNQFWRLLEPVIDARLVGLPYADKIVRLQAAGVGIWDVIKTARRAGSLDQDIRRAENNSLAAFAAQLPQLQALAFNGGKAAKIGRKQVGEASPPLVDLPSSSAAYCSIPFVQKQAVWLSQKPYLQA